MIKPQIKENTLSRLKRIEGQVRGIAKMVNEEKYCIDVINQVTAAERALDGVAQLLLRNHVETCLTEAIKNGDAEQKTDELINTLFKFHKRSQNKSDA